MRYLCHINIFFKNYFEDISNNKQYIKTWKYFVELYEYYQTKKNFSEITKREAQKIMALCLRIIFENPVVEDFYKSNVNKGKMIHLSTSKKSTLFRNIFIK